MFTEFFGYLIVAWMVGTVIFTYKLNFEVSRIALRMDDICERMSELEKVKK